jgi:FkbM family methyltransferase
MRPALLPEPGLAEWAQWATPVLRSGRLPLGRRHRRWRAEWQFCRAAARLSPSDIAIDCGASDGICTGLLAANGATVYAFEPDPHGFAGLRPMFEGMPNVHLIEQAVAVEAKQSALYRNANFAVDPDRFVVSSSLFSSTVNGQEAVVIDLIDFPAFISALPRRVAILKMDIEGAEVPIMERLLDTGLIGRIDYVFAET